MIQFQQVNCRLGNKALFTDLDLTIYQGHKVGLIGHNGAGKSTLLRLILGELSCDRGDIIVPKDCRIAHLRQEMPSGQCSALAYVEAGDAEVAQLKAKIEQAEQVDDGMALAELYTRLGEIDGYAVSARAAKILIGLGFTQAQLDAPIDSFSGGWRMRLNLAQVLLSTADVMLLDEPTNHLDLEGVIWLADWLKKLNCLVLVISHDRAFLDDVATHIVHFDNKRLKQYTGHYSDFEREYANALTLQAQHYKKQQVERAHLQKFIDRFRAKATKAKQVQGRIKMLERMADVAPVHEKSPFQFTFFDNVCGVNPMMTLEKVSVSNEFNKSGFACAV